ncbi:hypothetical protein [Neobacillus citreus]|uniref:Uncharacterized protein n=1 Tax=Neobacillus citreus TaxID=2833578 RepID=A0A942T2R4_9BACI|nr:hypothetical protein [Neobacillus citreus]MCH6268880.1 hypothetical protein [Neobacillus citreus]
MKKYQLNKDVSQRIVDGILQGYKNYIQERTEKNTQMKISTAYAWVKGNHIDDQTATICEEVGIKYSKAKAGYTWGYLQFTNLDENTMFIIKNSKYFNEENFPGGTAFTGRKRRSLNNENYLKKLSKINQDIDFPAELTLFIDDMLPRTMTLFDDSVMKSLEDNDVSKLQADFDKFYIITYETDQFNMVSSIKVWMPNPINNKAYLVEDLTDYIGSSTIDITDLDTSVLENDYLDFDYDSPTALDYDIFHEDDLPKEDEGNSKS